MQTILVTGSRDWSNQDLIDKAIQDVEGRMKGPYKLIHGGCKGADKMTESTVKGRKGWKIQTFIADWDGDGKRAGPMRNKRMVEQGPAFAIVFCNDLKASKGTKDCWKRIVKADIEHKIYSENDDSDENEEKGENNDSRLSYLDLGKTINLVDLVDKRWHSPLDMEEVKEVLEEVQEELILRSKEETIYPPLEDALNVLKCDPNDVEVVIIGQDPYIREQQAHGYAFSDNSGHVAPSLKNIIKVVKKNGYSPMKRKRDDQPGGNLQCWIDQGVFMINTILTVREGSPMSHKDVGWQDFTNHIIRNLANSGKPKVFLLWGAQAGKFASMCSHAKVKNLVLKTSHPSPLGASRGFMDCEHFKQANDFLEANGRTPIVW